VAGGVACGVAVCVALVDLVAAVVGDEFEIAHFGLACCWGGE